MRHALFNTFVLVAAVGCSVLSPPTQGPEVRTGPNEWTVDPRRWCKPGSGSNSRW